MLHPVAIHPGSSSRKHRMKEVAALTGKANLPPVDYHDPGYIAPKVRPPATYMDGTRINNPNDLMHTFTLMQMLMSWRGVYIKQKIEFLEAISGCET